MAGSRAAPSLRPFLPADAPRRAALFRESVETLAEDFYDEDQRAAWAARDFFAKRGFAAQCRNTVELDGEWLGGTRMTKALIMVESDPRLRAATGRTQ